MHVKFCERRDSKRVFQARGFTLKGAQREILAQEVTELTELILKKTGVEGRTEILFY
jgi:hypothetical protein